MKFKYSDKHREIEVYHYDATSGEYISSEVVPVPPNTGIPIDSVSIKPPRKKKGFCSCWNGTKWEYVKDTRGTPVYLKSTGEMAIMNELGELLDDWTTEKPEMDYPKWDGTKWIKDNELEINTKIQFLEDKLKPFVYAERTNIITDEEKNKMEDIMKCIVYIHRINTKHPDSIEWPEIPINL